MTHYQQTRSPEPASFFSSASLLAHLLRGAIGIAAIVPAVMLAQGSASLSGSLGSIGLGLVALVAFRGCPMCWTVGLFETAARSIRAQRTQAHEKA